MRWSKSYLAAHRPSWWNEPVIPVCPRCSADDEPFTYAVFRCAPCDWASHRFLQAVPSLDPASPLWYSPTLAKFIKATATGFPDNMLLLGIYSSYTTPQASPSRAALAASGRAQVTTFVAA